MVTDVYMCGRATHTSPHRSFAFKAWIEVSLVSHARAWYPILYVLYRVSRLKGNMFSLTFKKILLVSRRLHSPGKPDPLFRKLIHFGKMVWESWHSCPKTWRDNHNHLCHMGRALCDDSLQVPKTAAPVCVRSRWHELLIAHRQTRGALLTWIFNNLINNHRDVVILCCDINYLCHF